MKKKKTAKPAKKAAAKQTVKKAVKKAAGKPAAGKALAKQAAPVRSAVSSDGGGARPATYAPQPIQGTGWAPFRYPPQ